MGGPVGEARAAAQSAERVAAMVESAASNDGGPEPQVVQVVLADGDVEVRLVAINEDAGHLKFRQLSLDDQGEVVLGGEATIKLASIGQAAIGGDEDQAVLLHAGGPTGPVLLELRFDTAELAQLWQSRIEALRQEGQGGSPTQASDEERQSRQQQTLEGAEAQAVATLQALVEQQEEQVRLLEEINRRKEEQLCKMQERLEASLELLHTGQTAYAQQQYIVDRQKPVLEHLQQKLEALDRAERACVMNAAEAASGSLAAARAGSNGALAVAAARGEMADRVTVAAQQPRRPVPVLRAGGGAGSTDASTSAEVEDIEGEDAAADDDDDDDDDDEEEEEPRGGEGTAASENDAAISEAVYGRLQALMTEKGQIEAQLRTDQEEIEAQMSDLRAMMEMLGGCLAQVEEAAE